MWRPEPLYTVKSGPQWAKAVPGVYTPTQGTPGIMSPIPTPAQPVRIAYQVRHNKFSGSHDIYRDPSPAEPHGFYLACHSEAEARAISAFLGGDIAEALSALEEFRLERGLIQRGQP
jgi:hypothetical protein